MRAYSLSASKALLAVTICCSALQPSASKGASIVVTNLADTGAGSLRLALADAIPGATITFAVTGAITNFSGELVVDKDLSIIGPGPALLAVSGDDLARVFQINPSATVTFSGMTIRDGRAPNGARGTDSVTPGAPGEDGGGIYNSGVLILSNCVITACRSGTGGAGFTDTLFSNLSPSDGGPGGKGAGIYNAGSLTLAACTISYNTNGSGGNGGSSKDAGIVAAMGGSGGNGGGVYDAGSVTLASCTIAYNAAGAGGSGGTGGRASQTDGGSGGNGGAGGNGGGVYTESSPTFISCTFAANAGGSGGKGGAGGSGAFSTRLGPAGNGGTGGDGGSGGSGGGIYSLASLQAVACTLTENLSGPAGGGGQGGAGGVGFGPPATQGGAGGPGGNGGSGGNGGGACVPNGGAPALENVLAAHNSAASGGLGGNGGAGGLSGSGYPNGPAGSPGVNGLPGSGPDLFGTFSSNGHNLIGSDEGNSGFADGVAGDLVGSGILLDPTLGPLGDHGGLVFTCPLMGTSPALDAGDDTLLAAPWALAEDARGLPRKSGAHVDIGAFEQQGASTPLVLEVSLRAEDGAIRLTLTNLPGASLALLAGTNVTAPLSAWTLLGPMPETRAGQFEFIEPAPAGGDWRFYRVRTP